MDDQPDSNQQGSTEPAQNLPGATYQPGQVVQPPSTPVDPVPPSSPEPTPPVSPAPVPPQTPVSPEVPGPVQEEDDGAISWEASEHVDYDNNIGWMLLMLAGGAALCAGIYFLVDWMSALVVALLLGALLFYSKLKPGNVRYSISDFGITIGGREYSYSEFRSFSFNQDGAISSIFLVPMQRFMIPITMYVAPENQDQIAGVLAQHLPNQQRQPDFMDRLTAKLRL